MEDTPYDIWISTLEGIWSKYGLEPELILELACGTGNITTRLAAKGYDMIGVDSSSEMLGQAKEKASEDSSVLYLNQDMREFELYGTVDCIFCLCDGINYLLEKNDLLKVLKLVRNYLNPGTLFIFDLNTKYKYSQILSDNDFVQTSDKAAYIWQNLYDEESEINEYDMTFFVRSDNKIETYERFNELHYQRAYEIETVQQLVEKAGLKILEIFDMDTLGKFKDTTERACFVVRK